MMLMLLDMRTRLVDPTNDALGEGVSKEVKEGIEYLQRNDDMAIQARQPPHISLTAPPLPAELSLA